MQTHARRAGTDLWFITGIDSGKTQDKAMIHELYKPDWKAWMGDEGGERDGGPDDPRIALIEVKADSAYYLKSTQPRLIALFNIAIAIATGDPPKAGDMGELRHDLATGAARE